MTITINIPISPERMIAALAEIKREGQQRKHVYPRIIAAKKMTQQVADLRREALLDAWRIIDAVVKAADIEPEQGTTPAYYCPECHTRAIEHEADAPPHQPLYCCPNANCVSFDAAMPARLFNTTPNQETT